MKIAVIGGGISGLGAGVILSRDHEVHLFEAETRLGGHAHTVHVDENGRSVPLDIGFLVFNELTYPQFTRFLRHLGVTYTDTEMSLSIRSAADDLEWSGTNLNSVFGQRKNILRPRFYRMLFEILRFQREAQTNLIQARRNGWTLRELFQAGRYSPELSNQYILPIGAAIWSSPESEMLNYPAETFLTFLLNHKLLQLSGRPVWKTIPGGSVQYVQKAKALIGHVYTAETVNSVRRQGTQLRLATASRDEMFDRVIFATPAPTALEILQDATDDERRILENFKFESNRATLHGDPVVMPKAKRCWSSWNVLSGSATKVSMTYYLNRLQRLGTSTDYFLTLNSNDRLANQRGSYLFRHPLFDRDTVRAQRELSTIQGTRGVYFSGAWTRYGFHEDGLVSAMRVAELIGTRAPWDVV